MNRRTTSPRQALERLRDLCGRSEHCTAEIARKLYTWGIGSSDSDKIIRLLKRDRYIDDRRFTSAFVRDKFIFNHWGRLKIRAAPRSQAHRPRHGRQHHRRGDLPEAYENSLIALLRTRSRAINADPADYDSLTRLIRFALSRGYESATVIRAVKSPGCGTTTATAPMKQSIRSWIDDLASVIFPAYAKSAAGRWHTANRSSASNASPTCHARASPPTHSPRCTYASHHPDFRSKSGIVVLLLPRLTLRKTHTAGQIQRSSAARTHTRTHVCHRDRPNRDSSTASTS